MEALNNLTKSRPPGPYDKSDLRPFLFYVVVGIIYPDHYMLILIFGIFWEFFEIFVVTNDTLYNLTKKYWITPEEYWNETLLNKCVDVTGKMAGYALGSIINKTYKNKFIKSIKL